MKKLKTLLAATFKEFNPRRYLKMDEIELENKQNGVAYRFAQRIDIVDMLAIERDVYDGEVPWTFSHFEHEIVQNENAFFIVAEIDQKVVGFIGARVTDKGKKIHLSNLAVLKKNQNHGIATTLIKQIVRLSKHLGKMQMTLEVRRDNTKAQGLYRRNGFQTEHFMPSYYEDGGDAIWMIKKLRNDVND